MNMLTASLKHYLLLEGQTPAGLSLIKPFVCCSEKCLSTSKLPTAPLIVSHVMRNLVFNEARALLWIVSSPAPKFNTRCYGYKTTATTQIWSKELKRNGNRVLTSRTARIALPCVRSDSLGRDNSGAERRL